ncbi:hybrid sensor histidine kinase/response regulator [Desulfopila inferna]|uniref:hybrid sensor histidine kinase/response regulator n=1 Tax=Desulfopila inferna TaxID=468528 RepID=UPI0019634291|nr:ABC transporter substrate binding protein [Desulfopila inferna]MBM9603318.1 response regulator [Desulfopila inferna]
MMHKYRKLFHLLIFVLLISVNCTEAKEKKNVLHINSYHHGYEWSDEIFHGIRSGLAGSEKYKVDLQVEYMDTKKYLYDPVNISLFKLYQEKFKNEDFDVIIVSDNHAYNFVIEHREALFKGIPLVFCGMNNYEQTDVSSGNLTGIVENFDLVRTLKIARKLHPDKTKMVVVGDQSMTGRSIEQQVYTMLRKYDSRLEVEFWFKLSLEETKQKVERLADDTFLFFTPWYQTVRGKFYTAEEVMEDVYAHSSVPIYTTWEFLLGHGAVGGSLLSGLSHGKMAAEMALRILDGERTDDIPVVVEPSGIYKFDYNVMQKLNINQKSLPQGSIIINSPKAFYELPKELFWTIMVSFLMLVIVLLFLTFIMAERRKVQRKVQEQLSFQETLMDTIPQLVSWKDTTGRYLGANQSFTEFFGIGTPVGMISKSTEDVISDNEYVEWSVKTDNAVVQQQREFRKLRKKITDHGGNIGWLEVNKVPLRNQSGRIIGVLTSAENVTREQNLEKQLMQSQKMEAIGTLAGGIAHDFNNILTSILNSTELALGDVEDDSQTARDLKRVLKAARRGSRVVKQILSFSRPSKEGFRQTDLGLVCHEVLSLMDASLPSNIRVQSKILSSGVMVEADPTQMHQAILNLCTNAFHALQESGGNLYVYVEKALVGSELAESMNISAGEYLKLTVADDGPGIDATIIGNIFDPFFSTKDITEGTGLGLSVVHGIVMGHRGGIRVESETGRGTRFEIYLPLSGMIKFEVDEVKNTSQAEGLSILFVEDDEDQLNSVPRVLQSLGHKVVGVRDPRKAVDLAMGREKKFDLVISDYDMPAMRGTALAEKLPHLPCIIVSGRNDAIAASVHVKNIKKVMIKPYDKAELQGILNSIFDQE